MSAASRQGGGSRKQAVSIRMSRSDIRHIKHLAERLGTRDSDIIRFAIKLMLGKLAPLQDLSVRGRGLVPVFLESSPDLMRHFELDSAKLASIINDGVEPERRVDSEDIQLIAMSGAQRSYVKLRVADFRRSQDAAAAALGVAAGSAFNGAPNGHSGPGNAHAHGSPFGDDDSLDHSLRQYLYEKYLFIKSPTPLGKQGGEP